MTKLQKLYSIIQHLKELGLELGDDLLKRTAELETQIDQMVYALYNLTYEEVKIIDPNTPITKEEYEQ